jgi:hypothetical protein
MYTRFTLDLHSIYTRFTLDLHSIDTLHNTLYALHKHSIYGVCALYLHSIDTLCGVTLKTKLVDLIMIFLNITFINIYNMFLIEIFGCEKYTPF